jgi:hypothetical protein
MTVSPGNSLPVSGVSLNEPLLEDDYPIYADYLYVADGKVVRSDWHGITARQFKIREGYTELRRCDIYGRQALRDAARAGADTTEPLASPGRQA